MTTLPFESHPLRRSWDLLLASVGADCLRAALEHELFSQLLAPVSLDHLMPRTTLPAASLAPLLDCLWSLGLLERDGERYSASEVARRHFVPSSTRYCGEAWLLRLQALRRVGAALGSPGPFAPPAEAVRSGWAEAARRQLAQEQQAVTAEAAVRLVQGFGELPADGRFLDLGCGPGLQAIALALAWPHCRGVLLDFPESAAVARDNLRAAGVANRLQAIGADLRDAELGDAELGDGFDLVWCASVLHFVEDRLGLLRRIRAALKPGGRFLCLHAHWEMQPELAERVLPYYLPLRLRGHWVPEPGELLALLHEAGFDGVDDLGHVDIPLAPVRVLLARG
ncbi:SAM-dependent methyltransferase [Pseudomonas nitritireducens]|uniref:SAM-dependent methyltransferase n=1 Tax=Pseudomonas nitroreducens TaxID=46680 RepID=A0A7W7P3I4_PSENT|nr:class I SAM-dependent methyltransferase [Pseudomonas nitritireducens]MBB4865625.1 SAM-dependent methyltransferase [Pseudomonas nitritireducens]